MQSWLASCTTIGGSITQEIDAAPPVVWETVTDRAATTSILQNMVEQEIIREEPLRVGMVVRQVRLFHGKKRESFQTITAISSDPPRHYSISANVYLTEQSALSKTKNESRTGSWTLVEGKDDKSSVFVWTFSAIPEGLFGTLATLFCGRCLTRSTKRHFQQDLEDYAKEAERRQALKDKEGAILLEDQSGDADSLN